MRRFSVLALLGVLLVYDAPVAQSSYEQELAKWRQDREKNLKADEGWLTVVGLVFLQQGKNSFGSGPLHDIVLPDPAPAEAGVFEFDGSKVTLRARAPMTLNGKPVTTADLRPSDQGRAIDTIALGALQMFVHKSGDRFAIRLRDPNSEIRRNFTGLRWFEPNEKYRVAGRFEPYASARTLKVPNVLGDYEVYTEIGVVGFALDGQPLKLEAYESGSGQNRRLFIVFRDLTSGKETYPAARFLSADWPSPDGEVILDFNKAYNPPCAFNPYTTCPLPSEQNRLRVRIPAGEMDYHKAATH